MFQRARLGDGASVRTATAQPGAIPQAAPPPNPGLHYTFALPTTTLAANQQLLISQQVIDYDFEGHFLVAYSTGYFTAQFQIGSTRWLSNNPIHSANLFGTGSAPMPFIVPLKFAQGELISCTLQDISGAQNTVYIAIHGRQLS